ncbi:MAG: hypothetical protein ACJA01_002899 [Saprospiraceae bacterium]|jgi:hypothetical protein
MNIKTIISTALLLMIGSIVSGQCVGTCNGSFTSYGEDTGIIGTGNSFFGKQTGASIETQGVYNTFMGYQTGYSNKFGTDNSFFGTQTGFHNVSGSRNSFFGRLAGEFNEANDNSFFGYAAGDSTNVGGENSFFGSSSGLKNKAGRNNSFFGSASGFNNDPGLRNSFFGSESGYNNTYGSENSFFGIFSGFENIEGSYNSFFGRSAGYYLTGSNNIAIGNQAGPTDGQGAVDSTLYIDIKRTNTPLIYGHFGERHIAINGDFSVFGTTKLFGEFEINGAFFAPSSKFLKQEFEPVDPQEILEKVTALPISTWAYINKPDVRHIGPMAQDFYAAFGLGKDDVTIATVDADGLALASVQALHIQLEEQKKINQDQYDMIRSLLTRLEKLENE